MRLSLPLRIFLFHLIFMVALGALTALLIKISFESYEEAWKKEVQTDFGEELFQPLASEVARSLLLEVQTGFPEQQEKRKMDIGQALDAVLPTLRSIESLTIIDKEGRPHYASRPEEMELLFADEERSAELRSDEPTRREIILRSGEKATEVLLPVFDREGEERRRLGSVLIWHRADPGLGARLEEVGLRGEVPAPELLVAPMAAEVARSLLLQLEKDEEELREDLEDHKFRVSEGLSKIIRSLKSLEALVIVDRDRRIQYINTPKELDLIFVGDRETSRFASPEPTEREVQLESGEMAKELTLPIYDPGPGGERQRLGTAVVQYRPDPDLLTRVRELSLSSVAPWTYVRALILFLVVAFGGGILLAALAGLPVRRVERALADFRARGFRGGLDPKAVGLEKDLASTVQALNELGGRLEALDAQGREREALLATLSQSLEEGMVALDPSGLPVAWNRAALRMLTASEETGEPAEVGGSDANTEKLREALGRNADLSFALERVEFGPPQEVEVIQANGARVPAQVTRVPFEVRPGEMGTLLLIRNLATLRKVEAHLLEAGRFAVLAHLAAGLAHEIRNPLHSIRLNATVIEQYVDISGEDRSSLAVKDSLETIKDETQRLAGLLNNYLGMVRPEWEVGPVDIRELCRRVIQLVSYTARRSKVEIRLEGEVCPPLVRGVRDRLQQAILNLVLNAIQAMPKGGTISLRTGSSSGMVRLTVSDTGPGLSQELSDGLFDTRVTTKPEGTGLGLPLVRMIAEAHGGSVWYRSTPGEGAAFSLVLPAQ